MTLTQCGNLRAIGSFLLLFMPFAHLAIMYCLIYYLNSVLFHILKCITYLLCQVCEGLIHFTRKTHGSKQQPAIFAGLKGPDIARSLVEVQSTFLKNLALLKNVKHTILDVKVCNLFLASAQIV